ncbi:MAG: bifunctional 2-polyprenyl-6-hydroxyphenol methylase/3-demethylubiquinol 3-O-methyltransferase UbiG, partial [Pseudomonadota bacterium]
MHKNNEVEKFTSIAESWWETEGPFKTLHEINPTRMEYICSQIREHKTIDNLKILDVGCGGGIVSIPLARLGAKVTGIDAGKENIEVAKKYASSQGLKIDYQNILLEDIKEEYDVILCLEIIEHIDDLDKFFKSVSANLKPGGLIICSTLNRTLKGLALGIIAAEYILRWVPQGTHNFNKFVKPSELNDFLEKNAIKVIDISGMSY